MRRLTIRLALVAAGVGAGTALAAGTGAADQALPADPAKVQQADRLTSGPTVDLTGAADVYETPAAARAAAERMTAVVPLPEGGNLNGIRWEEAGGTFSAADVTFLVQYNALCQWTRASAEGRESATAEAVRGSMPRWTALRATEAAGPLTRAVSEPNSREAAALRAECAASHARETAWSAQRGMPPSR